MAYQMTDHYWRSYFEVGIVAWHSHQIFLTVRTKNFLSDKLPWNSHGKNI